MAEYVYLYQYLFNEYEADWDTLSVHRTAKGAYRAMHKDTWDDCVCARELQLQEGIVWTIDNGLRRVVKMEVLD